VVLDKINIPAKQDLLELNKNEITQITNV